MSKQRKTKLLGWLLIALSFTPIIILTLSMMINSIGLQKSLTVLGILTAMAIMALAFCLGLELILR